MKSTDITILAAIALVAAACSDDVRSDAPASEGQPAPAEAASAVSPASMLPDTTAEAVWAMLTEADYAENWTRWPGYGEYYSGNSPHGLLLTTYLNDVALEALEAGTGSMPVGAIIVKENFLPDSTYDASTVMVKREDEYNPDFDGWWWLKRNADGTVAAAGKGVGCEGCHIDRADNDFIFSGSLSGGR